MRRLAALSAVVVALAFGVGACSSAAKSPTTTTTKPSTQTTQMGGMDPGDTMAPNETMP